MVLVRFRPIELLIPGSFESGRDSGRAQLCYLCIVNSSVSFLSVDVFRYKGLTSFLCISIVVRAAAKWSWASLSAMAIFGWMPEALRMNPVNRPYRSAAPISHSPLRSIRSVASGQ